MKPIRALLRFCADELGVASVWMLCLLPVFLVILGLGMDGAAAFRTQNLLQSSADASALAAAFDLPTAGTASPTQITNAKADAYKYAKANMSVAGFGNVLNTNAVSNGDLVLGSWVSNTFTPDGTPMNAVKVTLRTAAANSNAYPTTFLALIGKGSWDIGASAIAVNGKSTPLCILILGNLTSNGAPNANLAGCSIGSNGDMTCHGHNLQADIGLAHGTDNGCGVRQYSGVPTLLDPYASLAANIPANTCPSPNSASSYPQETGTLPASNQWAGSQSFGATKTICGDLKLTADTTISSPAGGTVLVIENGQLDTNGHTLSTANGSSLTVIFTGPTVSGLSPTHTPTGSGTLNFNAPTSGTWSGVTIYQDPALPTGSGVDVSY